MTEYRHISPASISPYNLESVTVNVAALIVTLVVAKRYVDGSQWLRSRDLERGSGRFGSQRTSVAL